MPRIPPRIAIVGGVVLLAGGGAYYWRRRRLEEDATALEEEAALTGAEYVDPSQDPWAAAYGDTGYGSTYLSPPTSGIGAGGFGGTGEQQGTTLEDIIPLLAAMNQLPPGQTTGGGLPALPVNVNTGPGQSPVRPPAPTPRPPAAPNPVCTWRGHRLEWWRNPAANKRRGKWRWPDGSGKFKHSRAFEGHSAPDHRPCRR